MANTINGEGRGLNQDGALVDLSTASLSSSRLGKSDGIEVRELQRQLTLQLNDAGNLVAGLQQALLAGDINESLLLSQAIEQRVAESKKNSNHLFTGLVGICSQLRKSNFELESHCADLGIKIQELGFVIDELQR
jgi:hypothetical protein